MTSSRGIVLFAYNSSFDYVKIANVSAALAKKFTGLPVTLITDDFGALQADQKIIDNIIICSTTGTNKRLIRTTHDSSTQVIDWKNLNRASIFDLTPYDQTLLIDCDYLMFNDNLVNLFNTNLEFTCFKEAYDITGMNVFCNDTRLGQYSIPMLWATVIYFRKSVFSESIFDMMKLVQDNYHFYSKVYGFKEHPFRNDFALSIAYHALTGYGLSELLPFKLPSISSMTDVVDFRSNGDLIYQYKKDGRMNTGISTATDLHVMNKLIFTDEIVDRIIQYAT